MKRILKPWGYEDIWAHTEYYVGKILFVEKGQRLSKQYHKVKDESIYILSGILSLEIGSGSEIDPIIIKTLALIPSADLIVFVSFTESL